MLVDDRQEGLVEWVVGEIEELEDVANVEIVCCVNRL